MPNFFKIASKLGFTLLGLLLACAAAAKTTDTQIGRYSTVVNKPTAAQRDLLSQTIQMRFPENVMTVGEAMQYLLRYSGYSLADEKVQPDALKITLKKPLPLVDRSLQPMSLNDALMILAGPAFELHQDALNREVNFQVKPAFAHKAMTQEK